MYKQAYYIQLAEKKINHETPTRFVVLVIYGYSSPESP